MKKDLRNSIIDRLLPGSQTTGTLIINITNETGASVQGVYKALRDLKRADIVTIHNKMVSLSLIWIAKEKSKLSFAEYSYHAGKDIEHKLSKEGNKLTFSFKTLSDLDLFWTHAYTIFAKKTSTAHPRYMIIPHDFFLYARTETDSFWMKENITENVITRLVVTHTLPIDKIAVKTRAGFKNHPFEYMFADNPLNQKSNINYNILEPISN
jgi:hypothetical protein